MSLPDSVRVWIPGSAVVLSCSCGCKAIVWVHDVSTVVIVPVYDSLSHIVNLADPDGALGPDACEAAFGDQLRAPLACPAAFSPQAWGTDTDTDPD